MAAGRKKTPNRSERIVALEQAVQDLRDELGRVHRGRAPTMGQSSRCPACDGTRLLHFRHVKDVTQGSVVEFSLQKEMSRFWGMKLSAAPLEAYVCRSCRLVEWYAISLDAVQIDGEEVVAVEGEPEPAPGGPYR